MVLLTLYVIERVHYHIKRKELVTIYVKGYLSNPYFERTLKCDLFLLCRNGKVSKLANVHCYILCKDLITHNSISMSLN